MNAAAENMTASSTHSVVVSELNSNDERDEREGKNAVNEGLSEESKRPGWE